MRGPPVRRRRWRRSRSAKVLCQHLFAPASRLFRACQTELAPYPPLHHQHRRYYTSATLFFQTLLISARVALCIRHTNLSFGCSAQAWPRIAGIRLLAGLVPALPRGRETHIARGGGGGGCWCFTCTRSLAREEDPAVCVSCLVAWAVTCAG